MTEPTQSAHSWSGRRVCVAGIGISGRAAARALLDRDAVVLLVDARDGEQERAAVEELVARGADVRLGDAETEVDADLVVTSPGWRPAQPLLVTAQAAGVEVIGEPELAWRLSRERVTRDGRPAAPWLGVTGTNGKTTTVGMLAAILSAAGLSTVAAGNVGTPLVEVVLAEPAYDVIAVELSSFQLHWSSSLQFQAATVLNVAPDHLDWHGSMAAYAATKAKIWDDGAYALYNADDYWSRRLAEGRGNARDFSLVDVGAQFGVVDGFLVDRVTSLPDDPPRVADGVPLARDDDVRLPGRHNLANALAAAALARLLNLAGDATVSPAAVTAGLIAYQPGAHRNAPVATVDSVIYVDDSKATNPHAAAASLGAYEHVVWIAGGLLKGATVDELVVANVGRLRGVVLLGRDREVIHEALARHAPDVPVVEVTATDTGAMTAAVHAAGQLAAPGDTVLLAPAAASMDMFRDYAQRGDAFAAAVRGLGEDRP